MHVLVDRKSVLLSLSVIQLIFLGACATPKQVAEVTSRPRIDNRTVGEVSDEQTEAVVEKTDRRVDKAVSPGRFDGGKMWTFDNPPLDYFSAEYGFAPDSAWFSHARLGALRFATYCSASFVSGTGLIMSNHHCARESEKKVSRPREDLLENGFLAVNLADERKVKDLYVEQLIGIEDVTVEVYKAAAEVTGAGPRAEARQKRADVIENRLKEAAQAVDSTMQVQVIALYNGGKYTAYTYKRYTDIRLVFAPELQIGFFGGDEDNFTYPRYNLDLSFFRAYDENGQPLHTPDYFSWSSDGAQAGEAVFVVGNPGSTDRLNTVEQLEYTREYDLPQSIRILSDRGFILKQYIESHPEEAETFDLRNDYFSIQNTLKSQVGQLNGLEEGTLIERRRAALTALSTAVTSSDSLQALYGSVLKDIARLQISKKASARKAGAFLHFLNPALSSRILTRAMYGYVYTLLRQRGAPADQLADIRKEATQIESWPRELERDIIYARIRDLREALGASDPSIRHILGPRTIESVSDSISAYTALADSAKFMAMLDENYLVSGDVTVDFINSVAPLYFTLDQQLSNFKNREESFEARLARAQFAVSEEAYPPDATFSPRLADGIIKGYTYNGTLAPAFTTIYGVMDQHYSHPGRREWALPERWIHPPKSVSFGVPLNLVSTNDITGGNSGSPLLNRSLEVVGLVFDGNIESLPNQFLYTDDAARTVSVDSRGILEIMDSIYDSNRLVEEIRTGMFVETESEADRQADARNERHRVPPVSGSGSEKP